MAEKVVVSPYVFACLDAESENYVVEVDLPGVGKRDMRARLKLAVVFGLLCSSV